MKLMYTYSARRIPEPAIQIIDEMYERRKKKEPALRKCDLWIEAATKLKGRTK